MANALQLKRIQKHGILELWETNLNSYTGDLYCQLPGFEFLVPPYPVQSVFVDGKSFQPDPRTVLAFSGSEGHTERFVKANGPLKAVVITPQSISEICEPLGIAAKEIRFSSVQLQSDEPFQKLLQFISEIPNGIDLSAFALDCVVSELLVAVLTRHQHSKIGLFLKEHQLGQFPGAVARVKNVLFENLENSEFNLDLLAQEAGISKFHLIRVFKEKTGLSPAKYLNHVKTEMAKVALIKTKKSVISIAMELGFKDLSTFNKAFKKSTGLSPREFRRQQ